MKKKSILVDRDAYLYLERESRRQRGCKALSEWQEDRLWNQVPKVDGLRQLDKDSLGGGDGTYQGRWWSWSVETLKEMLSRAGYSYREGPEVEYINVRI